MSFSQSQFLNMSLRSVNCNIGWGSDQSRLSAQLYVDPANGDSFNLTNSDIGKPAYFTLGELNFGGLLQNFEPSQSVDGFPAYNVTVVDPRELLDGVQLILSDYNGGTGNVRNLYNIYGYWENALGFGGAQINETGIPYFKIRAALLAMASSPAQGTYGGPITYRDNLYSLDLDDLPIPPVYYRIGGTSISLLNLIERICEDSGCDFFVELRGFSIKIRTALRNNQPNLGVITGLINRSMAGGSSSTPITWYTEYLHINQPSVIKGQIIQQGQLLATIADLGTPHLHFGVGDGQAGGNIGQTIDFDGFFGYPIIIPDRDPSALPPNATTLSNQQINFIRGKTVSPVNPSIGWSQSLGSPFHSDYEYYTVDLISNDGNSIGKEVYNACGGQGVESVVVDVFYRPDISWVVIVKHTSAPGSSSSSGTNVVRAKSGFESRNETTSAFVVGGKVNILHTTTNLIQYWGFDLQNNPIVGQSQVIDFADATMTGNLDGTINSTATIITVKNLVPNIINWQNLLPFYIKVDSEILRVTEMNTVGPNIGEFTVTRGQFSTIPANHSDGVGLVKFNNRIATELMNLNASSVAEIIGSVTYPCSTLEMLCALSGENFWQSYIYQHRPQFRNALGMQGQDITFANILGGTSNLTAMDLTVDSPANAVAAIATTKFSRRRKLYELVKFYAQNYMGKKYLVGIPFALRKQDPDTLIITYSHEPTDAGYVEEGATPLGLNEFNQPVYETEDGRFRPFVLYDNANSADFDAVDGAKSALQGTDLYLACSMGGKIIYYNSLPYAAISLDSPVTQKKITQSTQGDYATLAALFNVPIIDIQRIATNTPGFGVLRMSLVPSVIHPTAVAIPLQSNILTYGPWYAQGAYGKVNFEQDSSLVPWNYGGFETMNLAANAKVATTVTNMQVGEYGEIELAELPRLSLGDLLEGNGPNLTGIDIQYGQNGVTCTYRFRTFTPRFGIGAKSEVERIKRLSLANQLVRRDFKEALTRNQYIAGRINAATTAQIGFNAEANLAQLGQLAGGPLQVAAMSPHPCLIAQNIFDDGSGTMRVGVSTLKYEEATVFCGTGEQYRANAVTNLAAVFRPFSTNTEGSTYMANLIEPSGGTASIITKETYNHWEDTNDIDVISHGNDFNGLNEYRRRNTAYDNARSIGLRGPAMMVGWGYDIQGNQVPNSGQATWEQNYRRRSHRWKAGPIDLLWEPYRGVWTSHDLMYGTVIEQIPPTGYGVVRVEYNDSYKFNMFVYNSYRGTMPSGRVVEIGYHAPHNQWRLNGPLFGPERGRLMNGAISASGNGEVTLDYSNGQVVKLNTYNFFNSSISSGKAVFIDYFDRDGKWYVTAADC